MLIEEQLASGRCGSRDEVIVEAWRCLVIMLSLNS